MAKVELKQPIVDEIKASLEGAQGVVVVDYRGLTVEQDTQLRKQLREAGVVYKVYKNTLVKRAIAGTEFEPMAEVLEGPNAIAICKEDATAPARVLANFAKTADALELKCGVVEGTYYDATGIAAIANIPSRDELLAKFLGSIQSPITNFARVIKQIAPAYIASDLSINAVAFWISEDLAIVLVGFLVSSLIALYRFVICVWYVTPCISPNKSSTSSTALYWLS